MAVMMFTLTSTFAQDAEVKGVIAFAYGDEVSIQSGSTYRNLKIGKDAVLGQQLKQGDLVQTGPKTVMEIQFQPSGTILKIAENTSVRISELAGGKGTMEVLYGRVRSKVSKLSGTDSYQVKSATAVAGVRGTDFGYDVLVVPGAAKLMQAQVYCFEGTVAVTGSASPSAEPVLVEANQFLVIKPASSTAEVLDKNTTAVQQGNQVLLLSTVMPEPIKEYWKERPLESGTTMVPSLLPSTASNQGNTSAKTNPADQIPPLPEFSALGRLSGEQYVYGDDLKKQIGMVSSGMGLAITLVSALIGAYGPEMFAFSTSQAQGVGQVGIISGLFLTLGGGAVYSWGLIER